MENQGKSFKCDDCGVSFGQGEGRLMHGNGYTCNKCLPEHKICGQCNRPIPLSYGSKYAIPHITDIMDASLHDDQ